MRIKLLLGLLLVVGLFLTASLLIGNRTLSSPQLAEVKTACLECHSAEPGYSSAVRLHDFHSTLNCSRCHSDESGLKIANTFHIGLEWSGIGLVALSLAGIIANLIIVNRRTRAG